MFQPSCLQSSRCSEQAPQLPLLTDGLAGGTNELAGVKEANSVDELRLLIDLHAEGLRQGPGGDDETRLAITLSGLSRTVTPRVLDIGCGTGTSTLFLARELDASVTAIDFLPEFLVRLEARAQLAGLTHCITTLAASMEALPLAEAQFDAVWSEGAIYNMGFEAGIKAWRKYLKPNGIIAVSELTWLTDRRPKELQSHWELEYPEVDTAAGKMASLERHGFSPLGYFPLPEYCWLNNYYRPMQQRFSEFLDRHDNSAAAQAIVAAEENEIALFEQYKAFVSYGFYIARRVEV